MRGGNEIGHGVDAGRRGARPHGGDPQMRAAQTGVQNRRHACRISRQHAIEHSRIDHQRAVPIGAHP